MTDLTSNERQKEIPIREIGRFFDTDAEGYLVNPASKEKIQEEWLPVVLDIVEGYKAQYGDALHSVYVRGSVAKGDAVAGVSDIDTFAYVQLSRDKIETKWKTLFEQELMKKYPFVQGVELGVDPLETASEDRILLLQSACVFGNDLGSEMPKVKVGKDTLGHVYTFSGNLKWFDEWASKPQEKEEIKKSCIWLMKRFLRTGLELTMERAGRYTRDLYPSYKLFSEYYPEKEKEMREALYLVLNPTDDIEVINKIRQDLGGWLEERAQKYQKNGN
jgi:uncharacterized protein